ncbi:MAG: restriction endonuclease [Desulfobacterales bacterium]|uniref:Restriction endonuclease n=1 Tax=Candidatus Desulfatibia vada TaxID=2841696 RepID=A0A8J6NWD6_9BACT|nr:restriction endonuclease [Candidatus Desulfatibia vada]
MPLQSSSILDYTTFIERPWKLFFEIEWSDSALRDYFKAHHINDSCPFCQARIDIVYELTTDLYDDVSHLIVRSCEGCGWWFSSILSEDEGYYKATLTPILRSFDVDSVTIPTKTLEIELRKRPKILHSLNPKKFEELVQSVFKDFFETDVRLVGRTGDGGIDLIFCDGETPFAVQVKRRQSPDAVENVSLIREFIGAMLLKKYSNGLLVSTAKNFSKGSKEASQKAIELGIIDRFELINRDRFIEIFRLKRKKVNWPWEQVYKDFLSGKEITSSQMKVTINKSNTSKPYN